jgi:LCP family protein required for cell wall assembly
MFDHLDDPDPYVPPADLRSRAISRGRSLKRRRRLAGGSVAAVAFVLTGAVGSAAVLHRKLDGVERIDVAGLREDTPKIDPQVVLFVGTDSDDGLAAPDPNRRPGGTRTDTILLTRIDPGNQTVTVLPLNRDLWVDIPDRGAGRLVSAYELGGPDLLIDTIHRVYGIEADHYVETDFAGAVAIGDALGGLAFSFPYEVQDQSGLHKPAGCQRYDGFDLLALGRARHLKYRSEGGPWRSLDDSSDLGRSERTLAIGAALVHRLAAVDARNPAELVRLVDAFAEHVTLDSGLSTNELIALFRAVSGSEVVPVRLPVDGVVRGGASVLAVDSAAQADQVRRFLGLAPIEPSTTTTLGIDVAPTPAGAIPAPC